MILAALRKIETEIDVLVERASDGQPIDPFDLKVIARKIGAQREMLERGLAET